MQDRPSAPELLDALAEYVFGELRPKVPREERFKTLVAANVCAVLARELRAGPEPSLADVRLFRAVLGIDRPDPEPLEAQSAARAAARELADAIRAGALDAQIEVVAAHLREHVRRKLDVARPGYAE